MKRFCPNSQCSHLNVLTFPLFWVDVINRRFRCIQIFCLNSTSYYNDMYPYNRHINRTALALDEIAPQVCLCYVRSRITAQSGA